MESSILTQMFLGLILFYFNTGALCSVKNFHYRRINEFRDKIPVDVAVFSSSNSSPIRCVQRCIRSPNCVFAFLFDDCLCRGYSVIYEINSPNLTAKIGASCYAVHTLEDPVFDCNLKGYAWHTELSICYKIHRQKKTIMDAHALCNQEHPRSRILQVDSELMYNFLIDKMVSNHLGPVYVQGTRFSETSFVDDVGKPMTYFRWGPEEPKTGTYLLFNAVTLLQETSSGEASYNHICRIY